MKSKRALTFALFALRDYKPIHEDWENGETPQVAYERLREAVCEFGSTVDVVSITGHPEIVSHGEMIGSEDGQGQNYLGSLVVWYYKDS